MDYSSETTEQAPARQGAQHERRDGTRGRRGVAMGRGKAVACLVMALGALPACDGSDASSTAQGGGGSGAQAGSGGTGGAGAQGGGGTSSTGVSGGTGAQGGGGSSTGGAGGTGGASMAVIGTPCPFGAECSAEAPACLSKGVGDATAYCTIHDCAADADCPTGFHCGITRDPHALCSSSKKGDNAFCGQTSEPCIDPDTDPTSIFEGSRCLLRRTCIYREPCAPCASDLDCSGKVGQKCADIGGEGRCARDCGDDGDCLGDELCTVGSCVPKFGACKGTGQFCEPCNDDEDCGDASSMVACADLAGGQRACFDYSYTAGCNIDADCPMSPGGKHGTCLDSKYGVDPGDPVYHRCYVPIDADTFEASCW